MRFFYTLSYLTLTINQLKATEYSELSSELIGCLERSVAFHNAELTLEERKIIENGFRQGEIKCLVSTATLAMGVNLPCSLVVIGELERSWRTEPEERFYKVAEYRNMSGRAGRYGVSDEEGESIYLANDYSEWKHVLNRYINGEVEPIESALIVERLDMMILYALAYFGEADSIDDIVSVLLNTFAGSHRWGEDFRQTGLKRSVTKITDDLITDSLVEKANNKYRLTDVGHVCAHCGLDRSSFVDLLQWLMNCDIFENVEYFAELATLETCQGGNLRFPGGWGRLQRSAVSVKRLLTPEKKINTPMINQLLENLNRRYIEQDLGTMARLVSTILAYTQGLGNGEIESRFSVRTGTINVVRDKFVWITEIASMVADILNKPYVDQLDLLRDSIKYGVPETGRHLARLNILRRNQTLKLVDKGITTPLSLLDADPNLIATLIFNNQVDKVIKLKEEILKQLGPVLPAYTSQIAICNAEIVDLIHQIYASRGTELERPFLKLMERVAPVLQIKKIKPQKAGEADFIFRSRNMENGIIQLASRGDPNKKIGINKAGDILHQSPELRPSIFVSVGFPNFDRGAEIKAGFLGENTNYKIISLPELIHLIIKIENNIENVDKLYDVFENQRGVVTCT